ncbi:uncharacterized protein LOC143028280 [Oratosquilla oratoria]|uniref:uncharacterized protein LOC143028280 n=1 Tax=Oratosquilla oratoria TaxID=337810 RepID=UPI003F757305
MRGLRVWLRRTSESEQERIRILLGYRDFTPNLEEGKSRREEDWDSVEVLLERVNTYLQDRAAPSKIVNVQTLDTVVQGIIQADFNTEESLQKFSQNGFTRFCRFIRVFFLTAHRVNHTTKTPFGDRPGTFLLFRDFKAPPDEGPTNDAISKTLSHVGKQIAKLEKNTEVVSISVIQLRMGSCSTSTTWRLESPFYCPNKFTFFVRVACKTQHILPAYTKETEYNDNGTDNKKKSQTDDKNYIEDADGQKKMQIDNENNIETYHLPGVVDSDQQGDFQSNKAETNNTNGVPSNSSDKKAEVLQVEKKSAKGSKQLEGVQEIKGVTKKGTQSSKMTESGEDDHLAKPALCNRITGNKEGSKCLQDLYDTVHCHAFIPTQTSAGYCSSTKWELFDSVAQRVIDHLWHVKSPILSLHTHQLYCPGGRESPGAAVWSQHTASGGLLSILHVFLREKL